MNRSIFMRRAAHILLAVFIFILSGVAADRYVLPLFIDNSTNQGILFLPGSEFPYKTTEFSHIAGINSLGFRGREWEKTKQETTMRIAAIGDSFTFGMGVSIEQTWPRILEKKFRASGVNVEIANLGSPGASPSRYVEVARKAIPLLNPDIIIVAILQGDDIAQVMREAEMVEARHTNPLIRKTREQIKSTVQILFPNAMRLMQRQMKKRPAFRSRERSLQKIWKKQAEELAAGYTGEKKTRFTTMGPAAKTMFLEGNLNPGIVSMAMAEPDYFATPLQRDNPQVMHGLQILQELLLEIKEIADQAQLLVISVPAGIYVSEKVLRAGKEIGFTATSEMLETTIPDQTLNTICRTIAIPFLSVTELFRKAGREEPLYYAYDGHFNAKGHEVFARLLTTELKEHLRGQNKFQ